MLWPFFHHGSDSGMISFPEDVVESRPKPSILERPPELDATAGGYQDTQGYETIVKPQIFSVGDVAGGPASAMASKVVQLDSSRPNEQIFQQQVNSASFNFLQRFLDPETLGWKLAKQLKLPEVDKDRAQNYFLNAIIKLDEGWANAERAVFVDALDTILALSEASDGAFATLHGVKDKTPECLCGRRHWYTDCWYLNASIRPSGGKPDDEIDRTIKAKLDESPRRKKHIERILKAAWSSAKSRKDANGTNGSKKISLLEPDDDG
ncbi:hypothetical protein AYO20_09092 [Fonsecaea nubica]|uniref:Uncharacterized protein n=1 Tax=Fonsecaea nubica TaxID=856822 RepID=A0A178CIB6_9EURO|nr:hypothetical protein AYO20_09092 [Fonsecaea nubica]OAL29708.1 hypothetical protein AYO20_09092 [Fonsecaea nubica]